MATNSELAQLSSAAYNQTGAPNGWTRLQIPSPVNDVGYYGAAFQDNITGEIVIAHRGTEIGTSQDRAADLQMGANQLPDQYQFARDFYASVFNAPSNAGATITTTGHSLGGSLAQLLAADKGLQATTFNPYGTKDLIPTLNNRYGLNIDPNATYNNITNHQTMLDGVSRLNGNSPIGSDQIGQMQTHVAASELPAAAMVSGSTLLGGASVVAFPATYVAVEFYWSHSIDRFTNEIFSPPTPSVAKDFVDFARNLGNQINAIESSITSAADPIVTKLQNDFQQLSGTIGKTYQDAVNTTSSAMGQLADLLSAAEKSAVRTFLDFAFDFGNTINGIEQTIADIFSAAQRFIPRRRDPLTLDLNGNGIETVPINATNPVYFDLTGEGVQSSVGWVAPNDGFLVLDRNGNGSIDDGTELFGDATPLHDASGNVVGKAADGFEALAQEDINGDGVVNSSDANFSNLRVWQDANQDGVSQAGELKTLAELGIASFNVANVAHSQLLSNGNQIADTGSYTRTDGSTGTAGVTAGMADVNLAVDTFHRTFADTIPLTVEAQALPDMQGSGVVRDLRQAASIQSPEGVTLATVLGQFSAATTCNDQRALLDTLISDWGATSGFEDMQTKVTAHGYTLSTNLDAVHQARLNALEQFNGRSFYRMPWETTNAQGGVTGMSVTGSHISIFMNGTQLALLDQAYSALKESVYDALVVQTRLKPYLDQIGLTLANGNFTLDVSGVLTAFQNKMNVDVETGLSDLVDFNRSTVEMLKSTNWLAQGWDLFGNVLATTPVTSTFQLVLGELGMQVEGQPGYRPYGSSGNDIIIGADQNSVSLMQCGMSLNEGCISNEI